jgi:hypothetical protein
MIPRVKLPMIGRPKIVAGMPANSGRCRSDRISPASVGAWIEITCRPRTALSTLESAASSAPNAVTFRTNLARSPLDSDSW